MAMRPCWRISAALERAQRNCGMGLSQATCGLKDRRQSSAANATMKALRECRETMAKTDRQTDRQTACLPANSGVPACLLHPAFLPAARDLLSDGHSANITVTAGL